MRRDKSFKTYGRHKNRVVLADNWLSDNDKKQRNVFGSSSEFDLSKQSSVFHVSSSGSETGALSLNSTGNSVNHSSISTKKSARKNTRSTKKPNTGKVDAQSNKENVSQETNKRSTRNKDTSKQQKNTWSLSLSDSSVGSEKAIRTHALRERNKNIEYKDSANLKKQLRGVTAKRKRPIRACHTQAETGTVNYSDFDDYSLVISDSPLVENGKITNQLKTECIETSTPVAKRTRCKETPLDGIKNSDLSHIEIVHSPASDTCYTSIETPDSSNRGSYSGMLSSPSILSSICSEDRSSLQCKNGDLNSIRTPENAVVQLQLLRDSFITAHLSGNGREKSLQSRLRKPLINKYFDNSDSLFSTPDRDLQKNLSLMTERLRMVSFIEADKSGQDSVEEAEEEEDEDEDESDNSEGEEEEEEESDEEVEVEDLSAIVEDEEDSSEEEEDEREEGESLYELEDEDSEGERTDDDEEGLTDELEDSGETEDSINHECDCDAETGVRVTRNTKNKCAKCSENDHVNLQRLSDSFSANYVSGRRGKSNKVRNYEITQIKESLESSNVESSDSNSTVYMINSDYSLASGLNKSEDLFSCDNGSLSGEGVSHTHSMSDYQSAESSKHIDGEEDGYHTADDNQGSQKSSTEEEDEEVVDGEITNTPPKLKYSLRDRHLQELQNSFTEMLTPTKRKGSLVPISDQTKVLVLCNQTEPVSFKTALPGKMLSQCKKIGEGVYGEVFRSVRDNQSVAIKIIPIEGDFPVNDEPQKKFGDIIAEIVIAKELSDLRYTRQCKTSNFCLVNSISCVRGKYPPDLLKQWDVFHKNKGSENDRPDMFTDSQFFLLFEFADCGTDLESYKFESLFQAKSALAQVTFALAVAEEALQFEHRDLHWGNVLIRPTQQEDICFKLMGKRFVVPSFGVEANIIDFTLSRLMKDGATVYTDLSTDDALFEGEGDYQFDIYRNMKKENGNDWAQFNPHANIHWLHYLADKLVYAKRYPSQSGRQERDILRQFRQFLSEMLNYHSASEMAVDAAFLNS